MVSHFKNKILHSCCCYSFSQLQTVIADFIHNLTKYHKKHNPKESIQVLKQITWRQRDTKVDKCTTQFREYEPQRNHWFLDKDHSPSRCSPLYKTKEAWIWMMYVWCNMYLNSKALCKNWRNHHVFVSSCAVITVTGGSQILSPL